jgi:serine/threonine protein kinase
MPDPNTRAGTSTPDVGATIGRRYRVVRRIGEGGMGVVVEAENVVTGKRVAIKWMHPLVASRPEAAERFLREARASARVRHPNVVDVYDVVHDEDTCFLVMELLEGEPLSMVLERGGVPAHELIALLLDAMRGVVAAHKQGVIHRDIKPDNIFLAIESDRALRVPKVLDFGISKVLGVEAMSLTRTGATMGTPMYMSYEQLCGVKDIDVRTDVYAFGVVLYEALTGRPPYQAENLPQLVAKMTHTQPSPPRELRPDIPEALDQLIQRAMSKERETRIGTLEELIQRLEPFASPRAFSQQLTAASAVLPRIERAGERGQGWTDAVAPGSLIVVGRESVPAATPMEANVPIPSAPRRRDALPWLVAAGVIATLAGVLTAYDTLRPPAPGDEASASGAEAAAVGGEPKPDETKPADPSGEAAAVAASQAVPQASKPGSRGAEAKPKPNVVRPAAAPTPGTDVSARPGAAAIVDPRTGKVVASPGASPTANGVPARSSAPLGATNGTSPSTPSGAASGTSLRSSAVAVPTNGPAARTNTPSVATGAPARAAATQPPRAAPPGGTAPRSAVEPERGSARAPSAPAASSAGARAAAVPPVAKPQPAKPKPASQPSAASASEAAERPIESVQRQPPAPPADANRFRAGRPRTEDF